MDETIHQKDTRVSRSKDSRLVQIAALATIFVAIITVFSYSPSQSGNGSDHGPIQSQLPADDASTPASGHISPVIVAGALPVGACLSDLGEDPVPVSCQIPHDAEVYANPGNCSEKTLITYLGGNPTVEILRSDLATPEVPDGYCIVVFPAPLTFDTSVQGKLAGPDSAVLRQCVNEVTSANVSCREKHTGEVVTVVGKNETGSVDCSAKAATYMTINPSDLSYQIKVNKVYIDGGFRCVIAVKGSNQLTDTVRMLGNSALPIAPY
ncbi:hypothetical protein [Arthrobacter sp. E3]|uniref:hypothetical protein n=1 Tax=Arthrobacter sp. E3 TaxID=517402 RepID=UPI001A946529|nr:hypothetical protein [Arthrobacter sp. E3]